MTDSPFGLADAERADLRTIVETIDREMSCVSRQSTEKNQATTDGLLVSWAKLVKLLSLGPAPETRECPACRHIGMRAATRCGYCWITLAPPPSEEGQRGTPRTKPS
jgi:hypothetical protein